ncbi:lytic transglycosylase domain-containing protein [Serratia marcescens]|uniref:lytic transglycosylase domain-containing protein n=1 Tax=Serratia marcescens TaxID=615 RepID=UPI001BAFB8EF|nr:lytic transglycosylase domain-containing protein [Serratia marcescens]MBS3894734.1 lytic transglycosylase domain-containing protein [Serratia marcescens]
MANPFAQFDNPPSGSAGGGSNSKGVGPAPYSGNQFESLVRQEATRQGVDPDLAAAIASKESSFNPNATSKAGAIGLMQVMPDTARDMGYDPEAMRSDPQMQARAGVHYLRQMIHGTGSAAGGILAYHDGLGNYHKTVRGERQLGPEGAGYISDPRFARWMGGEGNAPMDPYAKNGSTGAQTGAAPQTSDLGNPFAQFDKPGGAASDPNNPFVQFDKQGFKGSDIDLVQPYEVPPAKPPVPEPPPPTLLQDAEQAGKGVLQAGVNIANIPGEVVNTALGAMGVPAEDQVMKFQLPENLRPTDPWAKGGAEVFPYLVPGVGEADAARAAASVANAGRAEKLATSAAGMAAENAPGALAQASQSDNPDDFAENLAGGMAGSVAGRGVARGVSRMFGLGGESAAEAEAAAKADPSTLSEAMQDDQLKGMAKTATKATNPATLIGTNKGVEELASKVLPDDKVLEAARKLGMEDDLTPGMSSQNAAYRAYENALAATPGNKLYHAQRHAIEKLGEQADRFITDFGGDLDKNAINLQTKVAYENIRGSLKGQEDALYSKIREAVPTRTPVDTSTTVNTIEDIADDVGGLDALKSLYPQLSNTLKQLDPNTLPTYGRLDAVRQQIGRAQGKAMDKGPYADLNQRHLAMLANALQEDQGKAAAQYGAQDMWNLAREVGRKRFAVQKAMVTNLGNSGDKGIVQQIQKALVDMSQGGGSDFRKLVNNLPDEMVQPVVMSAMNKPFTTFAKSPGQSLGVPGFVKWYNGMSRNPSNMQALSKAIGYPAAKRLRNIYEVAAGMHRVGSEKVYSSSQIDRMMNQFDGRKGMLARLYGVVKNIAKAEGISHALHLPGAGGAAVVYHALKTGKIARTEAADKLIASSDFKNLTKRIASGNLESEASKKAANISIAKTPQYQRWVKTLSQQEKSELSRLGIVGWITAERSDN